MLPGPGAYEIKAIIGSKKTTQSFRKSHLYKPSNEQKKAELGPGKYDLNLFNKNSKYFLSVFQNTGHTKIPPLPKINNNEVKENQQP